MKINDQIVDKIEEESSEMEKRFENNPDHFSSQEGLSLESLRDVYDWSPTQRNKIDKLLRIQLKGQWPNERMDEDSFYAAILQQLHNPDNPRFFQLMQSLDNKQPKGKKNIFSLIGRLFNRALRAARDIDAKMLDEFLATNSSGKDNIIKILEFLSEHGDNKYKIVYDFFQNNLSSEKEKIDYEGEDIDSSYYEDQWADLRKDILHIILGLHNNLTQLSLGIAVQERNVYEQITELTRKGKELRESVLEVADQHDFIKDIWTDWKEFDAYCEELDKFVSSKNDEKEILYHFFRGLVNIVSSIEVHHRSQRTKSKLEESISNIIFELQHQLKCDSPVLLPGPQDPSAWFEWAFNLSGDELENVQDTLEPHYPKLSEFIGGCAPDWLIFRKSMHDEEVLEKTDTPVNDKVPLDATVDAFLGTKVLIEEEQEIDNRQHVEVDELKKVLEDTFAETNRIQQDVLQNYTESVTVFETNFQTAPRQVKEDQDDFPPPTTFPEIFQDTEHHPKNLFASCLKSGAFQKAYWIAVSCDVGIPADLIGAVALGHQIGAGSSIPGQLQTYFTNLVTLDFRSLPEKLFLFSAIVGTAVFTEPTVNEIYALIEMTTCGIQPIDDLAKYIKTEIIYKGSIIRPVDIDSALGFENIEQKLESLKAQSAEVLERNNSADFLDYAPAKIFLRYLYREGSDLVSIHRAVECNNVQKRSEISVLLRQINPEELIATAHTIGLKKCVSPITGIARNQLVRRINETLALGREWHSLVAGVTQRGNGAEKEKILSNLQQHLKKANDCLKGLNPKNIAPEIMSVPLQCFTAVIDTLEGKERQPITLMTDVLIQHEPIELDDDFEPSTGAQKLLIECVKDAEENKIFSEHMYTILVKRKEFLRTKALLWKFHPGDEFRDRLEQVVDEEQSRIEARISQLLNRVEDAYLLGHLNHEVFEDLNDSDEDDNLSQEALRSRLVSSLGHISLRLNSHVESNAWRIREIEISVDTIEGQLSRMEQKHNAEMQEEFNRILGQFPDSVEGQQDREYVREAFKNAIGQGDNIAAVELINRAKEAIQKKSQLPRASFEENSDLTSFVQSIENYQTVLGVKSKLGFYVNQMQQRATIAKIQFANLDKAHLNDVVSGMTAWNNLLTLNYTQQKSRTDLIKEIGNVFDFLDLRVNRQTIQIHSSSTEDFVFATFNLYFPIDCCPIPTFGSAMGTIVHLVLSQVKKEPDQLSTFLNRHNLQHRPVIMLYLQEMGLNLRRKYQQYCGKKKLSVLLIDLCLAFHLCGIRNRLPALFKIALPFSWAQPYLMKGENVPRETFVGRDEEVQSIYDPQGACIIFGGRQLGKSALLRHFYKNYNAPHKDHYVVYLDIDALGMPPQTHEQMQLDLWKKIYFELCREGFLVEREISERKGSKKIEDEVVEEIFSVLSGNPERQLYLLLDETDSLLDLDSSLNFPIVRRFRAMMAETGRRFKIVLAGLQSVQRYKNWKNHPFAQLGGDIVVRPLTPQAAHKLILAPLQALGFIFEEKGLILRILSQANYHPGLIQIFCYRLIENLYTRWSNRQADQVQRTIKLEDLQTIERNPEFIEDIRNRFDWTLDLDDRYKVLIYSLILTTNPTLTRTEREFMAIARDWWPQVFQVMDQQALRAVLDEMEGLGVLIREDEGHTRKYRLRSPNLLRLLGTHNQIEDELQRIISKDKPTTLNPRNFHPRVAEKAFPFGPLTKEQEGQISNDLSRIFGMTIISGSAALGLNDVARQFKTIFAEFIEWKEMVIPVQDIAVPEKVVNFIKDKLKSRNRSHLYVIIDLALLPRDCIISSILEQLLEQIGHVCTKRSRGHIYVLFPPEPSWQWLRDGKREQILHDQRVNAIELKRWSNGAITNALENSGIQAGAKHLGEDIFELSLGWHNLINSGMEALSSKTSGKGKTEILDIWRLKRENLFENVKESDVILREFGLRTDTPELNKIVEKIFSWSLTDPKMVIGPEIIEFVQEDSLPDSAKLLSDGGHKILEWLRLQDLIQSKGSDLWQINSIAGTIMKNASSQ